MQAPSGITNNQPVAAGAGGQVIGTGGTSTASALYWTSNGAVVNLNPANFIGSYGNAVGGTQQVGYGYGSSTGSNYHALLWTGTASSAVDLNPTNISGFTVSLAFGTNGSQQVGEGSGAVTGGSTTITHALLWNGTANSAVDLNPTNLTGFSSSGALATDGVHQVGSGSGTATGGTGTNNALLWNGSANSAVNLQPTLLPYIVSSSAGGLGGGKEVGFGLLTGGTIQHALLWSGTAASAVDLNPINIAGITSSNALATNGSIEVGWGQGSGTSQYYQAMLWSGTSSSTVDLGAMLPANLNSFADAIDSSGNVYGYATDSSGDNYGVEWVLAPEPNSPLLLMAVAGCALLSRRRANTRL